MMETINDQVYGGEIGQHYQLRGIRIGFNSGDDNFNFNGNALSSEKDALLAIVYEILCKANFENTDEVREEWEKSLKQKETDEVSLLYKYFYQNIFKEHPYSFDQDYTLLLDNLSKLNQKRLKSYYQQVFRPNNTLLFVYGDFKTAEMIKELKNFYSHWQAATGTFETVPAVENPDTFGQILLVDKANAKNARIVMGHQFNHAELFDKDLDVRTAFEVGNQVLGSGDFGSYLMDEIRSNKGYVYDISSKYFCNRSGGAFRIITSVRPDKACETVSAIKEMVQAIKTGQRKLIHTEVFRVINHKNAFFPESYRDKEEIIEDLIDNFEMKKHDMNYLNQYIASYNRVTAATAQTALKQLLFPEKMLTVIVGNKEAILPAFQEANIAVTVVSPK